MAKEDSKSANERGHSLVGSLALRASTRDFCPALATLGPSTKYFFLIVHYFHLFVAIAQQQAVQVVVPYRTSLNLCLCYATIFCLEIRLIFVLPLQKRMPGSMPLKINL